MRSVQIGSILLFVSVAVVAPAAGCGGSSSGAGGDDGGPPSTSSSGGSNSGGNLIDFDSASHCVNGQCVSLNCAVGQETTITGTVYDPAGNNPLPYVAVYVPATTKLPDLPKGAHCGDCQALYGGAALASAITGPDGTFTMKNVPVGSQIPLVVQAGKWRMQYSMPVKECSSNPYPGMLRLPRNGSEGSLPDIAISTGGADSLECLLTRIGVADSEFVNGSSSSGHIHIFQGGTTGSGNAGPTIDNNTPVSSSALWDSEPDLQKYDVVLLSCEGAETGTTNPTDLDTYVRVDGGKVFASHFHYSWFTDTNGPFVSYNLGQWKAGTNDTGTINAIVQTSLPNGDKFPKGKTLHDWLATVGALTNDELPIADSRYNVVVTKNNNGTPWINADQNVPSTGVPGMTQYFSWDEPINGSAEKLCGRVVYSDLHVGAASDDYGNLPGATNNAGPAVTTNGKVPMGCKHNSKLSPQEDALEFMLFDLSSCLTPPNVSPPIPPTVQ